MSYGVFILLERSSVKVQEHDTLLPVGTSFAK
jgi:hypothetical protein